MLNFSHKPVNILNKNIISSYKHPFLFLLNSRWCLTWLRQTTFLSKLQRLLCLRIVLLNATFCSLFIQRLFLLGLQGCFTCVLIGSRIVSFNRFGADSCVFLLHNVFVFFLFFHFSFILLQLFELFVSYLLILRQLVSWSLTCALCCLRGWICSF